METSQHNRNVRAFISMLLVDLRYLEVDTNGDGYCILYDTKQAYVACCIDNWSLESTIQYREQYDACLACIKAWKEQEADY